MLVHAAFMTCTVTGTVSLTTPTQAAVYGYATVQWYSTPTAQQLNLATAQVATLLGSLSTNTSGIFAGTNLTVTRNCACDGNLEVFDTNSTPFGYAPIVGSGLPTGFCDAKEASTVTVGVDNGLVTPANRGKFCSSPLLVAGGVAGTPGSGTCMSYGVATGANANSATAAVSSLQVLSASVTAAGVYSDFPAVTDTIGAGTTTYTPSVGVVSIGVDTTGSAAAFGPGDFNDFTSLPTVTITGTGGSGAAARPVMGLVGSGAYVANTAYTAGVACGTAAVTRTLPWTANNGAAGTVTFSITVTTGATATTAITVSDPGTGFTTLPTTITVNGLSAVPGISSCTTAFVPILPTAFELYVQSVIVTDSGSGYTAALPAITITGGGGTTVPAADLLASVKVTSIAVGGDVEGYAAPPTVAVTGTVATGFTGATAVAAMGVAGFTVTNGGASYTSAPTVTITQGSGSGASAQAVIVSGAVSQIILTAPGTGYLSIPTVVLAPPSGASTTGQLCAAAGSFIAASGSLPAIGVQTATGPDASSTVCTPIGVDSVALAPCSTPTLATGGISGTQYVGTCSVISSFVPATTPAGLVLASTCALMPVAFITTVTPSPPAPAPAPSPAAPSPKAPAPSPVAPACTYGGNYRMEAVGRAACGVEFPSYYGGSPANQTLCTTQSIQLRTEKQLPKVDRATFELASTGEIKTVRRGCAAGEAVWTPEGEKLRLLTTTTPKWKIEASAGDCNLVAIKSTATGTAAPYVSSPSPSGTQGCKSRQLFMTDKIYDTGRQLFRLRKV